MAAVANKYEGKPPDGEVVKRPEFPKATLQDAILIASAIERANGGRPYPPTETAVAAGLSPSSSKYRTLLSASSRRGLTSGAHTSKKITLLETGRDLVAPTSEESVRAARVKAALTPPVFEAIYEHFRGKRVPESGFFENTLVREYGVEPRDAGRCAAIFLADMEFIGLLFTDPKTGARYLSSDPVPTQGFDSPGPDESDAIDDPEGDEGGTSGADAPEMLSQPPAAVQPAAGKPERPKAIFVGHGPDEAALSQLTKILEEWGLPYKVAEYEPNGFRPISQKVADLMAECGAAILLFSADREVFDAEGNSLWLSSQNVSHELGAASVLYEGRVVVFKERGVDLASNYSGIGYIEFEKGALSAKAMELFREIQHFGLIRIMVGG